MTSARPAPGEPLNSSNGPRRVSAADPAPTSERTPSRVSTAFGPCPNTPMTDNIAIAAGNNDKTP